MLVTNPSPDSRGPPPSISAEQYGRFTDFFYRKTGLLFSASKRYFVDKRLHDRIRSCGCVTFEAYFDVLRGETAGDELQLLINLMTVNETYFFREDYQLQCLSRSILPEVVEGRRKGDRLRIWSVPCSTGEEPYSLALWLLERWALVDDYEIEIFASDIDTAVLSAAEAGIYGERALQYLPDDMVGRYFDRIATGAWQIRPELRRSIRFTQINLHDAEQVRTYRNFDVIFCRNLLIYFDDASRRRAADTLWSALNPGGFCCLGHSESMNRMSSRFVPRRFPDAIVYQRP